MKRKCYLVVNRKLKDFDELMSLVVERDGAFMTTDKKVACEKVRTLQSSYPYVGELYELMITV